VRVAKPDLVPTEANLLGAYGIWAELEVACEAVAGELNGRAHRVTRRAPAEMVGRSRPACTACPPIPTPRRSG